MNFKAKKGKSKYNVLERWIKKSQHLKNPFYRYMTKTLIEYDRKLNFWFDRWIELNFGPSYSTYFSLWNDNLQAKIGVKIDEISQKYWNPNKIFIVFFKKTGSFLPNFV